MFSVVIPLYNKANYVEKAVRSVLSQTFRDFEVIVVDDGSTDDGFARLQSLQDDRLRLIPQKNAGVSVARNNGVKTAQYDYIAFLDADDWWDERFLEQMEKLISDYPEAALYATNYYSVKNRINRPAVIGVADNFQRGYIDYFDVYAKTFWAPVNCSYAVIKKTIFVEEKGFQPSLRMGEDLDLWLRVALKHKVGYLNQFLAYSNQDAETSQRALGAEKRWKKEEHVTFNLTYLHEYENQSPKLKYLLDGLRLRSLIPFYLQNVYSKEIREIVKKIDFSHHPFLYRFVYTWPKMLVLSYFLGKKYGSFVKQALIHTANKGRN
ncbi:glycosyltransferase family 2 protein [Runella salmonicolor]|uniref:Glycosyltransferase family 2 protein n=1 Tax=Runella salmonicolor TaxID=2950278 RepID=A0ABT1FHJ4_9BACT|nr:glycosyltransferase family 2 protein [Runella salmonicolor]MCP1381189.1 glycosyltransferase family 2 protein [Runella salmonicolor]